MADNDSDTLPTTSWRGGAGSWGSSTSWSSGVPDMQTIAVFAAGVSADVDGDGAAAQIEVAGTAFLSGTLTVGGDVSLTGNGALVLFDASDLAISGTVTEATAAKLTIAGVLESSQSVVHGRVTLAAAATADDEGGDWRVDGTLAIQGGVVTVSSGSQLNTNGIAVTGGGVLVVDPGGAVTASLDGGDTPGITLDHGSLYSETLTAAGQDQTSLGVPLMLAGSGDKIVVGLYDDLFIEGPITGATADGLQVAGHGTLVLDGDNSFAGGVVIDHHAELVLGSATAAGSGTITFAATAPNDSANPLSRQVGGVLGGTVAVLTGMDLSGSGFAIGDAIDVRDLALHTAATPDAAAVTASYDAASGVLSVNSGSVTMATVILPANLAGQFSVARDGQGGTTITLVQGKTTVIADAVRASEAVQTHGVTGANITVGVISDSFNAAGGMAQDIADGALPSVVDIRSDKGGNVTDDEGRAMAQIVHAIAPGASIAYSSVTGNGSTDQNMADAINRLVTAGARVIVDDLSDGDADLYTEGAQTAAAIRNAVAHNVVMVTCANNTGQVFYEHALNATATTLPGSTASVYAYNFGDTGSGASTSPFLQQIRIQTNQDQSLELAWQSSDVALAAHFFQKDGDSYVPIDVVNVGSRSNQIYNFPGTSTTGYATYYVAFTSETSNPHGLFKYIISSSAVPPSVIDDVAAGIGSGTITGHQLDPNEIAVAASNYTTIGSGQPPAVEGFSASGPGLLLQPDGTLAAQTKPDITAPDGGSTTVTAPNAVNPDGVGGLSFFQGTSAAAPAFAAVAALMLQADQGLNSADLLNLARDSAISMADPTRTGAGLVQADRAVGYAEHGPITQFAGGNTTLLGTHGDDQIITNSGATTVDGGAGADTVDAGGQITSIIGGSGSLLVNVASGSVVLTAGSGSATVNGGVGDTVFGGSAGHNSLTGGGGGEIWGGGAGDLLQGGAGDLLGAAAAGNATLVGSTGNLLIDTNQSLAFTGDNAIVFSAEADSKDVVVGTGSFEDIGRGGQTTVFGGSGTGSTWVGASHVTDVAGTGQGTLVAGTGIGDLWINADAGAQTVLAIDQAGGGSINVLGFRPGVDQLQSIGYQPDSAVSSVRNGSLTLTLSDHTTITFVGVAALV